MSRRGLLAAGAFAVLAGCGEEDEVASPADALLASLAAERAFGAAVESRRIAARSRERAGQIEAAISAEGGRPHDASAPSGGGGDPVVLGRAALAAHIGALPVLGARELRRLAAGLVAGAAADLAVLGDAADPFQGSTP